MAANEYDELGQLIRKSVGGTDVTGEASLQKVDYRYNIRGWLKSINDVKELNPESDLTDLFAFKIMYNQVEHEFGGEVKPLFNGHISQTFWKNDSDNVRRSYDYKYDDLNRLLKGIYQRDKEVTPSWRERNCSLSLVRASRSYPLTQVGNTLAPRSLHQSTSTENEYDELGQLIRKSVGGADVTRQASLQKVDYRYNIRGWLKSINTVKELTPSTDPTDLFAFKISYNEVTNDLAGKIEPLFNGNISETFWKTAMDNIKRNYGYQYDALNRLTGSIYQKNGFETNSYNEYPTYDKNGNILTMYRTGYQDGSDQVMPFEIDKLVYGYAAYSNKLLSVYDQSPPLARA